MNSKTAKTIRKIARVFFPDQAINMGNRSHYVGDDIAGRPITHETIFHDAQSYKGCIKILSRMSRPELIKLCSEHNALSHIKF